MEVAIGGPAVGAAQSLLPNCHALELGGLQEHGNSGGHLIAGMTGQGGAALAGLEPLDAASLAAYASYFQGPAALPAELGVGDPKAQAKPPEEEGGPPLKRRRRAPSAARAPATSRYRGVSFHTQTQRWKSQIKVGGRDVNLGRHTDEEAAARAYDRASICARGTETAAGRLNFHVSEYAGELDSLTATPLPELAATLRGVEERMASLTSRFHGVRLNKRTRRWEAYLWVKGKHMHLGCHASEVSAAQAHDQAAILRHAHALRALGPAETARLHPLVTNFSPEFYQALLAGGGGGSGAAAAESGDGGAGSGAESGEQAAEGAAGASGAALAPVAQLGVPHFKQLEAKFAQALLERCHAVGAAAELGPGEENLQPPPPAAVWVGAAQRGGVAPDSEQQAQAEQKQAEQEQAGPQMQAQVQLAGVGGSQAAPAGEAPAGNEGKEAAVDEEGEVAAAEELLPLEWLSALQAAMGGSSPPSTSRPAAGGDALGPFLSGLATAGSGGCGGEAQQESSPCQPGRLDSALSRGSLRRHMREDLQQGQLLPSPPPISL